MRRYADRRSVIIICITVVTTLLEVGALAAQELATLEFTSPVPIFSYFEGMRGRLPLRTPALADDPLGLWLNPALLGTGKAGGIGYVHTYSESSFSGDDAFSIALGGLAFGAEFMKLKDVIEAGMGPKTERFITRRYTLGSGGRLAKNLYLGSSYSWHTSEICDIDEGSSWSVGALFRPYRTVSLGLVARDLNRPTYYGTTFEPIYETSVAVRPWDERLTLFANWFARSEELQDGLAEPQPRSYLTYGFEAEPWEGIAIRLASDQDLNISGSLALLIATGSWGASYTFDQGEKGQKDQGYGTAMVTLGTRWRQSVLLPPRHYLEIDLSGAIKEAQPPFSLFRGGGARYTLRELLDRIEYAKESRDIQALVIRCGDVSANFAIYDELRQALLDFRGANKKVVAYVETPGNEVYYVATAADYIILTPNGYIGLVGLKSEGLFLRGTLEKLGMKAFYARVGKYKSAVEPLTEDQYTEPSREAVNALLDDVYEKMISGIAEGRDLTEQEVRDKIDAGPYLPSEAVREGLVDTLAYWDEVPKIVNMLAAGATSRIAYSQFAHRRPAYLRWDEPPVIGIVYGVGGILSGTNRTDIFLGDIMGSETISQAFKALRNDASVRAVVFRVDSPGGMMTASDKIRREVELTAKEKPVIISMGGVAASGGYHISCYGTEILADEATVTGSIGVLNLWLHTRGFYEKIGADKDIFLRGRHADIFPNWREVTAEDIDLAQHYVDKYYDKFIGDVARGRNMGVDEVHQVAQGRVWSGKRALDLGLIDRIGGLDQAVRLAKKHAGISQDQDVEFRILPKAPGLFDALRQSMVAKAVGDIQIPQEFQEIMEPAAYLRAYDDPILYLMPYRLGIK